jgi:hypothetical protein
VRSEEEEYLSAAAVRRAFGGGILMSVLLEEARQDTGSVAGAANATPIARRVGSDLKIIRATRIEEITEIRDIAHEFHAESRYAHLPFSEEKFARFCSNSLLRPEENIALYVQYRGKTVGILTAGSGDYYLGEGGRLVTVYVMYVSARVRDTLLGGKIGVRLIRMVSEWARAQLAEELHIHSTSGIDPERTDKLLSRLGFKTYGGNYAIAIR